MIFTPPRQPGMTIGLVAAGLLIALELILSLVLLATPPSAWSFFGVCALVGGLGLLLVVVYRTWALWHARYVVSRNALVVEWGGRRLVWPMADLLAVGTPASLPPPPRPRSIWWPGNLTGHAQWAEVGPVEFLAATPAEGWVVVQSEQGGLVLSPGNVHAFLTALAQAKADGPEHAIQPEDVTPVWEQNALWQDRLAGGLVLGSGLSVLGLLGYLLVIYAQLPPEIALHFDAQRLPDRWGPPSGLFILPMMAALIWGVNTLLGAVLHARPTERAGAYWLWGTTAVLQGLVWLALWSLLTAGPPPA